MVYLPKKPVMIFLLIISPICIIDGFAKKNTTEIVLMSIVLVYAAVTLFNMKKKKQPAK